MKNILKKIIKFTKFSLLSFLSLAVLFSCNNYNDARSKKFQSNTIESSNVASDLDKSHSSNTLSNDQENKESNTSSIINKIDENGIYTSKEEVALYIYTYHKLPQNYITKGEAKKLGWNSSKNYVGDVAKGKSIGGDRFDNNEKHLPTLKGRKYFECDIDYKGKKRNAKRIIYADDFDENVGFIYYTDDHYKTFEKLY